MNRLFLCLLFVFCGQSVAALTCADYLEADQAINDDFDPSKQMRMKRNEVLMILAEARQLAPPETVELIEKVVNSKMLLGTVNSLSTLTVNYRCAQTPYLDLRPVVREAWFHAATVMVEKTSM